MTKSRIAFYALGILASTSAFARTRVYLNVSEVEPKTERFLQTRIISKSEADANRIAYLKTNACMNSLVSDLANAKTNEIALECPAESLPTFIVNANESKAGSAKPSFEKSSIQVDYQCMETTAAGASHLPAQIYAVVKAPILGGKDPCKGASYVSAFAEQSKATSAGSGVTKKTVKEYSPSELVRIHSGAGVELPKDLKANPIK